MWQWVKIPKALALVAFFLPWMTVSCSGTKLVSATGFGLALGRFTSELPNSGHSPSGGHLSLWLIAAMAAIAVGLILTFRSRASGLAVTATSAAAFVLILIGTSRFSKSAILAEAAKGQRDKSSEFGEQAAAAMIQVDWHFGYWLALLALAVAGVMAWLAYSGRDSKVTGAFRGALNSETGGASVTCSTCGRSLPDGTRFCPDDGTAIG